MHFEETKYSCCCFCFSMPLPTIKDDAESSLHMTCNFTELALTESGLSDVQLLKKQHCSCYAACHICTMQDQFTLIFHRLPPLSKIKNDALSSLHTTCNLPELAFFESSLHCHAAVENTALQLHNRKANFQQHQASLNIPTRGFPTLFQ